MSIDQNWTFIYFDNQGYQLGDPIGGGLVQFLIPAPLGCACLPTNAAVTAAASVILHRPNFAVLFFAFAFGGFSVVDFDAPLPIRTFCLPAE